MRDDVWIESVAEAVADSETVDWRAVERRAGGKIDAGVLRQLRQIAAIGVPASVPFHSGDLPLRALVAVSCVALVLAGLKTSVGLLAPVIGSVDPETWSTVGPFLLSAATFGLGGVALVLGGGADSRVRSLGAVFLLVSAAFADPLLRLLQGEATPFVVLLRGSAPESFLAFAFWLFVWTFPAVPLRRVERLAMFAALAVAWVTGVALSVANVALAFDSLAPLPGMADWLSVLDRRAPTAMYWPLVFGFAVAAVPALVLRGWHASTGGRRRVGFFVAALAVGLSPILIAVLLTTLVPGLAGLSLGWSRIAILVCLLSVVPMTAYAVAVHRVMRLRFIVRATAQYVLARSTVWLMATVPLAVLVIRAFWRSDLPVAELMMAPPWTALPPLVVLGGLALTFRHEWLRAIDAWFLRESLDDAGLLAGLERELRSAQGVRAATEAFVQVVEQGLHPTTTCVMLIDYDRLSFAPAAGTAAPLPFSSTVVQMLRSLELQTPLALVPGTAVTRLLPGPERQWLLDGGFHLLSALRDSTDNLIGFVAVGEHRHSFPYTRRHLSLLGAMSTGLALWLENRSLRESQGLDEHDPERRMVRWANEPGTYCPSCNRVWPAQAERCRCGGELARALLPATVNGKFDLEELIGYGGTSVVYAARDRVLDRRVAIKTLPARIDVPGDRLRREAQAMARVQHPNLASIFGLEYWRTLPFLVVEHLDGGTHAERLALGTLSERATVELGILLADVLDRVHSSGILHRDIKPSNIGYTREGIPKVLDFGLAALFDGRMGDGCAEQPLNASVLHSAILAEGALSASNTVTVSSHLVGTPLYLSPEAVRGEGPHPSFDLWSLALVLYEGIAGRHPLAGKTVADVLDSIDRSTIPDIRDFAPDCSEGLAAFFHAALSSDPADRPQSADQFRDRLHEVHLSLRRSA